MTLRRTTTLSWAILPLLLLPWGNAVLRAEMLDAFDDLSAWEIHTAEGVEAEMAQDLGQRGMGMRLDFDFHGSGGFLIAQRRLAMELPDNYNLSFYIRGEALPNNLEIKLIGPKGQNVWWFRKRNFEFPSKWRKITVKKRHFSKAWGPSDEPLKHISAIEIAVSAGMGGKGSVWIDELELVPRPVTALPPSAPKIRASTSDGTTAPENLLDQDPDTVWHSGTIAEQQWLMLDFGQVREFGGLVIDWDREDYALAYDVELSDDGQHWSQVYSVEDSIGGRDYVYLPDAESRFLLLNLRRSSRGKGYGIRSLQIKPYAFSATPNHFYSSIARDQKRGLYPRYFYNEQTYWTVVGTPGGEHEALINEDGMVELKAGAYSVEPFLFLDDRLITWLEVQRTVELLDGYLPIPSVVWHYDGLRLKITALATGDAARSRLLLRYELSNEGTKPKRGHLYLALRPFQVNPPWQSLNMQGGVGAIQSISYADSTVIIDGATALHSLSPVQGFGAAKFEQGDITHYLKNDTLPSFRTLGDRQRRASAALQYAFDLAPNATQTYLVTAPLDGPPSADPKHDGVEWDKALARTKASWDRKLERVDIRFPGEAQDLIAILKTTLAYILINQDGPALQPGSRDYARSWIRDGAITANALLALGLTTPVRRYIEWYARFVDADGRVPCCVDHRGPDPTPEYDSQGEWIYLVMQYYRFTRDIGFLTEMWPSVKRAVRYLEALRRSHLERRHADDEDAQALFRGLLPRSISHEGYSARPVHSYWDDFFALRGYKDAAEMARILGERELASNYAQMRDAMRRDLYASIQESMHLHGIDYIPGAAELGDFDATSTAIAVDPVGELAHLPQAALRATFERYFQFLNQRLEVPETWTAYTPYEWRIVTALIRMGERKRAHTLSGFLLQGLRPRFWNEWAEIVWRDEKAPRFIGDMPHTWVGAEYLRALRTLLVYERESDHALVLAAGVPDEWITREPGVSARRLPTYYGPLNFTYHDTPAGARVVEIGGDLALPPGGIVVHSPHPDPIAAVTVNGEPWTRFDAHEVRVDRFPVRLELHFAADPAGRTTP